MRVFVTGASGSLGQPVVRRLLACGHTVTAVTRTRSDLPPAVAQIHGDLTDLAFVSGLFASGGFDVVMHLSASLGASASTASGYLHNAVTPVWLMQQAVAAKVQRLVFASSMSVYAPFPEGRSAPITEDYPKAPTRLYGVAKLSAELACALLAGQTEFVALRFAPYFGTRKPAGGMAGLGALLSSALAAVSEGKPFQFPDWGDTPFDPIYDEDAARALVLAASAPQVPPEHVVHVSGQQPLTSAEFVQLVREIAPSSDLRLERAMQAQGRQACAVFDNTRAQHYLGYTPEFSGERAFRHFIEITRLNSTKARQE